MKLESKKVKNDEGINPPVPDISTFRHIFENAKKGNEMALVILDEWNRFCKPVSDGEKLVAEMIKNAADKLIK